MNIERFKTTLTAGILAASMILPSMTAFAATNSEYLHDATDVIVKEITTPEGVTYTNDSFQFKFTQRTDETAGGIAANESNVSISNTTISASSSTTSSDKNVNNSEAGTWKQTVKGNIDLSGFTSPGAWTYDVEEVADTNSAKAGESWTYDSTNKYILTVFVYNNDNSLQKKVMIQKKGANGSAEGTKLANATFSNTMTKTSSFTLTKAISDSDGLEPANQEYTFTVTIAPSTLGTVADQTYTYKIGANGEEKTLGTDGKITLKSGETATFTNVPAGSKVKVEETAVTNVASTKINVAGSADDTKNGDHDVSASIEGVVVKELGANNAVQTSITYTNTWKTLTVTGVVTNVAPYVTLVVVAVAAIAAYITIKRRIAM